MKKYNANKEFTKALIYIMLKKPQKYYEYKDFQGIFTRSESDIRRSLGELISARILEVSKPRGKPPGESKNQDKRKCYRISNKIRAFKELLKIYSDSETDMGLFLNSKYIKLLFKNNKFIDIYEILQGKLNDANFRKTASLALLSQPNIIKEYKDIADIIYNYYLNLKALELDENSEIRLKFDKRRPIWNEVMIGGRGDLLNPMLNQNAKQPIPLLRFPIRPIGSKHIDVLQTFCPLEAIGLYREAILPRLLDLYTELNKNSYITNGLYYFLECDTTLSPFTSFPFNNPQSLLLNTNFQRIFDNAYLLEPKDRDFFAVRAYMIYSNFKDILFELFRNNLPSKQQMLEQQIKQYIFEWNVASTNFDSIWLLLDSIYGNKGRSLKLNIKRSETSLQIIDLETNKPINGVEGSETELSSQPIIITDPWTSEGGAKYMEDPFNCIRSCECFKNYGATIKAIPIDYIILDLKRKLKENGIDYE
jgi:hypothetical protein